MMSALATLLVLAAIAVLVLGMVLLSNATLGVGVIGGAAVVMILARIVQASGHQEELLKAIQQGNVKLETHPSRPIAAQPVREKWWTPW